MLIMVPLSSKGFMVLHYYLKEKVRFKVQWKTWNLAPGLPAHYKLYFSYQLLFSLSLLQISSSICKYLASKYRLRQLVIIFPSNRQVGRYREGLRGEQHLINAPRWAGVQQRWNNPWRDLLSSCHRVFGWIRNSAEELWLCCRMFLDSSYRGQWAWGDAVLMFSPTARRMHKLSKAVAGRTALGDALWTSIPE